MPEFELNIGPSPIDHTRFRSLPYFVQGYIEAAFFSSTGGEPGELTADHGFSDLASETLAQMLADCEAFQRAAEPLLDAAYATDEYDDTQAGRDFWFTRNGHGVGFWDREALSPDLGEKLSTLCGRGTSFPEIDLYVGDNGQVYSA